MRLEIILNALMLLTAVPVGYILAWLCKDEIKYREWFYLIFYGFIVAGVIYSSIYFNVSIVLAFVYMTIVTVISLRKGRDKKFVK